MSEPVQARPAGVALCFSGGVDSFHTLLRSGLKITHLIFVVGYDIRISDGPRAAAAEESFREVARAVGAQAVLIRTNLREHPAFALADWRKTHGGALAAVGHLLAGSVGTVVISSTYASRLELPWGSHWRTDPLWSSSRLEVIHWGAEYSRADKVAAIAEEGLVRKHLRVCWENRSTIGNCGQCEKCIRTMLILAQSDQLKHFAVFGQDLSLADRIHRLRRVAPHLLSYYEALDKGSLNPEVQAELEALLSRSRRPGLSAVTIERAKLTARWAWRWMRYPTVR